MLKKYLFREWHKEFEERMWREKREREMHKRICQLEDRITKLEIKMGGKSKVCLNSCETTCSSAYDI